MKAYLIDDERLCIEDSRPDVVFLDIDMPRLDGLEMALKIQARHKG